MENKITQSQTAQYIHKIGGLNFARERYDMYFWPTLIDGHLLSLRAKTISKEENS
jgi:hypothetical protein